MDDELVLNPEFDFSDLAKAPALDFSGAYSTDTPVSSVMTKVIVAILA